MTTVVVAVRAEETVAAVRERLRAEADHRQEIDSVLVIDEDGRLVDDVSLFELLLARPDDLVGGLVGPPWPVVVDAGAPLEAVVEGLIDNRRSSLVVVDADSRPIGRILADDVVDALVAGRRRLEFRPLRS
jgi:Mg/Co/Ni transporter MgtE